MSVQNLFEKEINSYISGTVQISEGRTFSQYNLVKRIDLFANKHYPTGDTDSQGNYKHWFEIQESRINGEVKNVDFDSKDIFAYSEFKEDEFPVLVSNIFLRKFLRDKGKSEEINDALELGSGWGNVIWKKVGKDYETLDPRNTYIINQTAKTLKDTPVIERHIFSPKDLRAKKGIWDDDAIEHTLDNFTNKFFKQTKDSTPESKTIPYYEIYERNGEISEKELFEAQEKKGGDESKYVFAKIVLAGLSDNKNSQVLFADEVNPDEIYKEYHRGPYKGRWWREGLYELLFDIQIRCNEVGNQLARGLEWTSKTLFVSADKLVVQNAMTDLLNGDIIVSSNLQQIDVRMRGFDQLIAEWNRLLQLANEISNSFEVVQGQTQPSGTPFRLVERLNLNANKLFDRLREKFAIPYRELFNEWVLPDMLTELKTQEIISLSADSEYFSRLALWMVDGWYRENLVAIGPHSAEQASVIKQTKLEEILENDIIFQKLQREMFKDFKPRIEVIIHGESVGLNEELESLATFIQLEADPIRRRALIEIAMQKKGIDVAGLPKTPPNQQLAAAPTQTKEPRLAEATA